MIRPHILATIVAALAILAAGCGGDDDSSDGPSSGDITTVVEEGAALYATYCAACHGTNLEGHPDWRTPNADGTYNPPPHDATGHTWHHGDLTLVQVIADGSPFPQSAMPTFGDTLTDEQILAILEFLRSNWGEQERAFQRQATERELAANS